MSSVQVIFDDTEMIGAINQLIDSGYEFVPEAVESALQDFFVPEARRLAPRDTGGLIKSIIAKAPVTFNDGSFHVDAGSFGLPDPRARVQEFGAIIKMTDRMRRYLFAVVFKSRPRDGSKTAPNPGYITIPAQPYIRPAWNNTIDAMVRHMKISLQTWLGGTG